MTTRDRAQANLIALVIAVVLVISVAAVSVSLAAGAFDATDREPHDRRLAVATADWIVDGSSPLTNAPNAIDVVVVQNLSPRSLAADLPIGPNVSVSVSVGGETVLHRGDPLPGATVRRLVVLERVDPDVHSVRLTGSSTTVRLSNRSDRITVDLTGTDDEIYAVIVNGRRRLQNASGLNGRYTLPTERDRPPELTLKAEPSADGQRIRVTAYEWSTTPGQVVVRVNG